LLREHLTKAVGKKRVFKDAAPLLRRVRGKEKHGVLVGFGRYRTSLQPERQHFLEQYEPLDVAFKVVGTGSIGMRVYVIYMQSADGDDPLFLQIKEEAKSVYAAYLPMGAVKAANQGQRVVNGQRAMQLQSDPLLGFTSFGGRDYLVRQLNDHKATLNVATLAEDGLKQYAEVCGEMLARGHVRSSAQGEIQRYVRNGEGFRKAVMDFAQAYAQQTKDDWVEWSSIAANRAVHSSTR
jgi:uncharacterized protein (DUF2252 family)